MFEELIGKKVKCVWKDGDVSKSISGEALEVNKLFITIQGSFNKPMRININSIITLNEYDNLSQKKNDK